MTTELAVYEEPALGAPVAYRDPLGGLGHIDQFIRLAEMIQGTELVPAEMRNRPDAILAVFMAGYELGIGPIQSVQGIDFIKGRPSTSPELMRALIQRAGHQIIIDATDEKAIAQCQRRDWAEWRDVTYSMTDAKRAGLAGKENYQKMPRAMLSARVTSEAGRLFFADVINGMSYTAADLVDMPPIPQTPAELGAAFHGALVEDPNASTTHQRGYIRDLFGQAEITAADEQQALVAKAIGRRSTKPTDLTRDEATKVIDALEALVGAPKPGEEPFGD